ncbi:MAG: DUF6787 family protein [Mariniphaga sp.]|jgi:hypothetical protein
MIARLKKKWNVKNNFQLVLILIVFSITGSASIIVKKAAFQWIGIDGDTALWLKIPLYVLIVFPAYQVLLLIIGTLFGQFRFVWEMEKKIFSLFDFRMKR